MRVIVLFLIIISNAALCDIESVYTDVSVKGFDNVRVNFLNYDEVNKEIYINFDDFSEVKQNKVIIDSCKKNKNIFFFKDKIACSVESYKDGDRESYKIKLKNISNFNKIIEESGFFKNSVAKTYVSILSRSKIIQENYLVDDNDEVFSEVSKFVESSKKDRVKELIYEKNGIRMFSYDGGFNDGKVLKTKDSLKMLNNYDDVYKKITKKLYNDFSSEDKIKYNKSLKFSKVIKTKDDYFYITPLSISSFDDPGGMLSASFVYGIFKMDQGSLTHLGNIKGIPVSIFDINNDGVPEIFMAQYAEEGWGIDIYTIYPKLKTVISLSD